MLSFTTFSKLLLLVLTLPRSTSPCEKQDKPLLLSPLLDKNQVDKARLLSKVDKDCLEDFVPNSHTGFITVDKELGNHLFFWFFPSTEKEDAPLLLWLNGGPTVSSMLGLFWENGPMEAFRTTTSKDACKKKMIQSDSGYVERKYSWTKSFSMLYVDNPVGVGFSFSDSGKAGLRHTEEGYTKDLVSFLKQFLKIFPEYGTRGVYLGGQSYAGKYISALAYDFHTQIQEGRSDLNLQGIYLGAPFYDPQTQHEAYNDYLYAMGVISFKTMLKGKRTCKRFFKRAQANELSEGDIISFAHLSVNGFDNGGSLDNIVTREKAGYEVIAALLKRPEMTRAIHVGDRKFVGVESNSAFGFAVDAMLRSTKPKMAELLNHYKMLIYNGDYDIAVSTPMIEAALLTTPWTLQDKYENATRSTWQRGNEVLGYYSLTGKFCRILIRGSGHQVPHEKPEISYIMMQQFIKDGCVSDLPRSSPSQNTSPILASPVHINLFISGSLVLSLVSLSLK